MPDRARLIFCTAIGLLAGAALIAVTVVNPPSARELVMIALFGALVMLTMAYSISIGGGQVSLMPMSIVATYLIHGHVVAGWTACVGMLGYGVLRWWRARRSLESREPTGRLLIEATTINVAMHVVGVIVAAAVYESLGGRVPLLALNSQLIGPLIAAAIVYMGSNHIVVASYLAMRGPEQIATYKASFLRLWFYEAGPLIFAPLTALIYTRLGAGYFLLFALALSILSLITHHLALTSERLQRRVQELNSLQAVGQVLSGSLDIETVVWAIYEQVAKLMPAPSFYMALYDPELEEIAFPVAMVEGRRVHVETRKARHGLTEHVMETRQPLLIQSDVLDQVAALGLDQIGRPAACWMGIPIVAGDEALGMIALQSYDEPGAYDQSHLEILQMIAAQAAIAIQNARLYERTDEALARRVQELDSVLRTSGEGVLLLDPQWQVLAANRALADFVRVAQSDLVRHPIDALRPDGTSLMTLIHYTPETLSEDCDRLAAGEAEQVQVVVGLGPSDLQVERTLTPVRDNAGAITGWLLVFRDLTEELELEHLREDLTGMLVHDLRSPMSLVLSSLTMLTDAHRAGDSEQFDRLVGIACRSSDRILTLIDDLLDIGQLERKELPLHLEPVTVGELFSEIWGRYAPVASSHAIRFDIRSSGDLPVLYVDRSLVTRVLSNLVDNAMKFTADGGNVTLWAECTDAEDADALCLAVRDTGPGIPPEAHPQLFQKFQQVPSIHGRRRGTGLGLPFCKLVVEAHGGTIWVESEVGAGSTFRFTLPTAGSDMRIPEDQLPSTVS